MMSSFIFLVAFAGYLANDGNLLTALIDFDFQTIMLNFLLQFINCFVTIITAVVLSRAYMRANDTTT